MNDLVPPVLYPASEDRLWEAARDALRSPKTRAAIVLRLSQLQPTAPRTHHRRIACAMLEDAALRYDGRVFLLSNGDAVLLYRMPTAVPPGGAETHPSALPHLIARLFRVDVPDPSKLIVLWTLERHAEALLGYISRLREAGPAQSAVADPASS